jgi:hypothetical protein
MSVGVYDEYNWQSGMAGGQTIRNRDYLREQHLFWTTAQATHPTTTLFISDIHCSVQDLGEAALSWQFDGGQMEWTDWNIVAALGHSSQVTRADAVCDVTPYARMISANARGCRIEVSTNPRRTYSRITVFVSARSTTSRVPNYLLPETARAFIQVGYEPYWKALSDYFGTTIQYFFFDQPHASFYHWRQHYGNLGCSLPFAPNLIACLQDLTAHNIGRTLLALVLNVGPDTATLRAKFYEVLANLATQNFLEPLHTWTSQRGVYLTGHEVLGHVGSWHPGASFRTWDLRVNFGLDYFGVDSYRDQTTVDAEGLEPQLSTKMGDSVARAHGRSGCTVEQYFVSREGPNGVVGRWGLSLQELRAQIIRLHFLGAKQFLMHAFYQSDGYAGDGPILSNPRFDFAPGINFEPWWPFFSACADESARLSAFLDSAQPATEVAVLYPLRTIWAEGSHNACGDHIAFWAAFLARTGYGYHFIDERDLPQAQIKNGALCLDTRSYQALILPAVTLLQTPDHLRIIEHFLADGGMVLASGTTIQSFQEDPESDAYAWFLQLKRQYPQLTTWRTLPTETDARQLLQPLLSRRPWVECSNGGLWQWCGADFAAWRLALFNDQIETISAILHLPWPAGTWEIWDVLSGDVLPVCTGAARTWTLHLNPMQLVCLRITQALDPHNPPTALSIGSASLADLLARCHRRQLTSGWHLEVSDQIVVNPIDVRRGWELQGLEHFSGTATYVCQVEIPSVCVQWWLYLPSVQSAVRAIWNDIPIGQRGWSPYLFPIPSQAVHPGTNTVKLHVANTAANRYLNHTRYQSRAQASGILDPPVLLWHQEQRAGSCDNWGFHLTHSDAP